MAEVDLDSKRRPGADSECGRGVDQADLARTQQHLLRDDTLPNAVASAPRLGSGLEPPLWPLPMLIDQR